MPRAVLLDLYDTLVDGDWRRLRDTIARHLGVEARVVDDAFSVTRPDRSVGRFGSEEADLAAMLEATGLEADPSLVRELATVEYELLQTGVRLHADSLPTVDALRRKGVTTVLVSNCSYSTGPVVDRLGLAAELDAIVLSYQVGARKPQPAIYRAALEAAGGVDPADAVFVDDQVRYCDGARDLGIDTRLIWRDGAAPSEGISPDTNGHRLIRDLSALLDD
jgi:HAD superfamily hydrolase (TIGR01509 family)